MNDPSAIEAAEAQVLGSTLLNWEACVKVTSLLQPDDFSTEIHQSMAKTIWRVVGEGRLPSAIDLRTDKTASLPDILAVSQLVASSAYAESYAKQVADASFCRKLSADMARVVQLADGGRSDAALAAAQQSLLTLTRVKSTHHAVPLSELITKVLESTIEARKPGSKGVGMRTGFPALDNITLGMRRGELTVLGARPMLGKTALALCMANGLAANGYKVGILSLEMQDVSLALRLLSGESGIEQWEFTSGHISDDQMARAMVAAKRLSDRGIYIDDTSTLTSAGMRTATQRMVLDHGIDVIMVDFLGRLTSPGAGNREQELSNIAYDCKALTKDLNISGLLLSQLSRASEREGDEPELRHLAGSGGIEAAADLVYLMQRTAEQEPTAGGMGTTTIHIKKHRNGPLCAVELGWDAKRTRFFSLTKRAEPVAPKEEAF